MCNFNTTLNLLMVRGMVQKGEVLYQVLGNVVLGIVQIKNNYTRSVGLGIQLAGRFAKKAAKPSRASSVPRTRLIV